MASQSVAYCPKGRSLAASSAATWSGCFHVPCSTVVRTDDSHASAARFVANVRGALTHDPRRGGTTLGSL